MILLFGISLFFSCQTEDINEVNNNDNTIEKIFDIVGQYEMNDGPHDLAVKGNYVFACRDDKIYVVDFSDKNNPKLVKTIDDLEQTNIFETLLIEGNVLYAGCTSSSGVYVIDITNITSPIIVNKYIQTVYSTNKLKPLQLFYNNGVLWATGSNGLNCMLVKYNVSNLTLTLDKYWVSTETGNIGGGVWANSTHVFVSTAKGKIHSLDVNDISKGLVGTYTFSAEAGHEHWGKSIVGDGNKLFWADWGAGVITVNITNPATMTADALITHSSYKSQFPDAEGTNAYDLALNKTTGKLYVANGWSGLLQINLNNLGKVENYVDYKDHQYFCIALADKYALLGNISGGIDGKKGIKIIKIEN